MTQPAGPALDGNWFADFFMGQRFRHATLRTITVGDASLHIALTGARQPLFCSAPLAAQLGHPAPPVDDTLVFNMAFGKTVGDISGNAVANLGYADLRLLRPVYAGDTIRAESEVIGLRPTSAGDTLYCFSEVLERIELPDRRDCGALRLRLTGIRNAPAAGFVAMVGADGARRRHPDVVLDLDYTVLMPRKETPCP